jgi:hypothetical protein
MAYRDPERRKAHIRGDYLKNRTARIAQIHERQKQLAQWVRSLKIKCSRCPETHEACLDFHHRDSADKVTNLSTSHLKGWGRARILKEMEKCEVVCSNCHRKQHWEERNARVVQQTRRSATNRETGGANPSASTI